MNRKDKSQKKTQQDKNGINVSGNLFSDKRTLYILTVLTLVTFTIFYPVLKAGFVNWDDDVNVYENQHIDKLTSQNIKEIFTNPVIGNYNPLPILSFAIDKQFFGLNPFAFHLHNLLLHLINTVLVFFLASRFGLKPLAAFFMALLFGIHPLRVESVAWVTERKDLLFGLFTLGAMLCYTSWLKEKKRKYLLWTYVLFVVSVFAKIQAVALPLSLLAIDFFQGRKMMWKPVTEKFPMFIISLIVGILGIYLLSEEGSLNANDFSFVEKILVGSYSLLIYIVKSAVPFEMSAVYPFPEPGKLSALFYISPVVIAGLAILIIYSLKRTRVIAFGTVFFLFNIMFLLQVVSAGQGFIADRFGYIAFIGLFFIYAWGFQRLEEKKAKWRPWLRVAAIVLLLIYAGLSRNQVYAWQNSETLWTDVLSKYKNATQAYVNRGKYYRELKQNDKAMEDFNACIRVNPDDYNGYNSRGRLYFDLGETDKAITDFNRAIELNPVSAKTYSNRGAAYGKKKDYSPALVDLNKALELDPEEYEACLNRAIVNFYTQKYPESAADCKSYLKYKPNEASVWDLSALCYKNMKDYNMALANSDKAIRLNPSNGAFYMNRSYIHFYLGNKEKARSDIERAVNSGIKPDPAFLDQLSMQ